MTTQPQADSRNPPAAPSPGSTGSRALQAMRRRAPWIVAGLVLALAITFFVMRRHARAHAGADTPRPIPVAVATAETAEVRVMLTAPGNVVPVNSVVVRTRVDGQLMRVAFTEGQRVRAGELLAEIDPRPFAAQLAQAQGQFERDQALFRNAQLDAERYRLLYSQDSIARQQLDTQEALVRQYEGVLGIDRALLENARLQLSYCRITAPFAGRVGLRQVDPGNLVRAADQIGLATITQTHPITATFSMPQDYLPALMRRLKEGAKLEVEAYNRDRTLKIATGHLLTVDNEIDAATGTVKLKATFSNENSALFPNQFVNIGLLLDTIPDATVIPAAAIRRGQDGAFVFVVVANGTVAVRQVTPGQVDGNRVAITSGISSGETVVVDGIDKLRDGAPIQIAARTDAPATPAPAPQSTPTAEKTALR
jgi:multidrug efflux system membrane fusion protein